MKETLEKPANFEKICFHSWRYIGKWRDGSIRAICKYCGEEW
jgi:hypothetical protein